MRNKVRIVLADILAIGMIISMSACGGSPGSGTDANGNTKIQFFQSKSESVDIVNQLIKEFESENPDIKVEQQAAPDSLTVLKSRITKNDIPDVIAVNVSNYFDV